MRNSDSPELGSARQSPERALKEVSDEIHQTLMRNQLVSDIDTKDVLEAVAKLVQKKK